MPSPEIEEFAKELVEVVRDIAIGNRDAVLMPQAQHAKAKAWRNASHQGDLESIAKVDSLTIFPTPNKCTERIGGDSRMDDHVKEPVPKVINLLAAP